MTLEDVSTICPTVEIISREGVKRLGKGYHHWFSENVYVPSGATIEFRFQGSMHLLALYNEGMRKQGETAVDDLYLSKLRGFERKLTFVPAGHAYREWHETGSSTRLTFLYLDPASLGRPDDEDANFLPRVCFESPVVWETASKLKKAIEASEANGAPYLQALSSVLSHELSKHNQDLSAQINRGGLAGWQKRAVIEYVEQHVGSQACLRKMAALTQLSVHHFCRAFKRSFGIPPYQYQVERRMELAKSLLADQTIPITEISLRLGYGQTSSFSSAFRKMTGWTPTAFRREFNLTNSENVLAQSAARLHNDPGKIAQAQRQT